MRRKDMTYVASAPLHAYSPDESESTLIFSGTMKINIVAFSFSIFVCPPIVHGWLKITLKINLKSLSKLESGGSRDFSAITEVALARQLCRR